MKILSYQELLHSPVASHGLASELKAARFVVDMPATVAGDTIEFGYLPQYAVPVDAIILSGGAFTGDVELEGETLFSAASGVANTPLRASVATAIGMNVGATPLLVTGTATANGSAGKLDLVIIYAIGEDGEHTFEQFIERDVPNGAITINGLPLTINGKYLVLGV